MKIPLIERVKIQAQVLVPLVKALRKELGEERANALVAKALGDHYRKLGREAWARLGSAAAEEKLEKTWKSFSAGAALELKVLRKTPAAYELDVTECQYAKFYRELGEPELGFLLVCSQDSTFFEGAGGMDLKRTQTIMQGASRCDFRYALKAGKP
jgi:predicted ArsR family transcriptional regulator